MKYSHIKILLVIFIVITSVGVTIAQSGKQWVVYEGKAGPGNGKHIVFVSGDEEYRSEEALPMLAKILAERHGFKCTVLFAIDPKTGKIDPDNVTNIPGLKALQTADLMVLFTRFRELPDNQMKYIDEYLKTGKPVVGLRTATHAFRYTINKHSPYAKYSFDSRVKGWEDGFGHRVVGETWVSHHGEHTKEGTRGLINGLYESNYILQGVKDIWGPTDVYSIRSLTPDTKVLVFGQSSHGMASTSPLSYDKSIMPVAWIKSYKNETGKTARIFNTTMGASVDFESAGLRRLLVNACYWAVGMEKQIPKESNVNIVGEYNPTMYEHGGHKKDQTPASYQLQQ
ncbi:ThuA domain-containing protein [soil metagenome]